MRLKSRKPYEAAVARSRPQRMKWWNEARYGMFIHWGLYAQVGRNEWVMAIECIPRKDYEKLADTFKPKPRPAREWARLAKAAGMNYMVMTTKHHEGFCLWDTAQTTYNAMKRGPGRDLVAEFVDACREFDLNVGFYYSLMDWHHPDGARAAWDPAARRRFIDFTHGCVRELMTQYGKIDILWYDVALPFQSHEGWDKVYATRVRYFSCQALSLGSMINNPQSVTEPLYCGSGDKHAALQSVGDLFLSLQLPGNGRKQTPLRGHCLIPGVEQEKTSRAVGVFSLTWGETCLAK